MSLSRRATPKSFKNRTLNPHPLLQLVLRMKMLRSLFRIQQCLKFFRKLSQSFLDGKVLKNLKSLWMTQMLIWPLMIFWKGIASGKKLKEQLKKRIKRSLILKEKLMVRVLREMNPKILNWLSVQNL